MSTYKVQAGDTLSEIAAANNTTVDEIAKANGISNVNLIRAGQELNIPGGTAQPKTTSGGASKVSTAKPTSTGKKLSGVSSGTQNQLDYYSSGYKQSDKVSAAEKYLEELRKNKPVEYQSQYEDQLSQLLDQIMNRGEFTYDLNSDVLYQQAKDQYVNLGRMAMMDTMGQAAALTGGYGNSYASTAGNQAYQAYLTQLNENIPEYYQLALDAYQRQGEDLYNRYGILNAADQTAYDRYRDTVSDYYTDLDYATNDYWNKYNADYGQYSDMLSYWQQQAQFENSDYWQQQDYNLQLQQLQLQKDQFEFEKQQAAAAAASRSSGGGGGGSSSSSTSYRRAPDSVYEELAAAYQKGGDAGIYALMDKYAQQGYDVEALYDWVTSNYTYNKPPKTGGGGTPTHAGKNKYTLN